MPKPPLCHPAADRDRCVRRFETRRPYRIEIRRSAAQPRLKKELQLLALFRQVTIECWTKDAVRFDTVIKPVNEPGNSVPTAECLEHSC